MKNMKKKKEKKKKNNLIDEDGQSQKLEEKKVNYYKQKPLFDKDVNDPAERGWD